MRKLITTLALSAVSLLLVSCISCRIVSMNQTKSRLVINFADMNTRDKSENNIWDYKSYADHGGSDTSIDMYVDNIYIGHRNVNHFSYSVEDSKLKSVSWSEGPYTLESIIQHLNEWLDSLSRMNAQGVDGAQHRVNELPNTPSVNETGFRELSFAIRLNGRHYFVRTVYSYDLLKPFVLRFEVSR